MSRAVHLWREEPTEEEGWTRTGVVVEAPREPRQTLWTKVLLREGWTLSPGSDPHLLVPLFKAMRTGGPLRVEGDVSPSLLAGLEEFQRVLACWHRGRFSPVEVVPGREVEQPAGDEGALLVFSAGVDACFTAFRHATGGAGRGRSTCARG